MKIGDLIEHPPSGAVGVVTYVDSGYGWAEIMLAVLGKHDTHLLVGDIEQIETKFWRRYEGR